MFTPISGRSVVVTGGSRGIGRGIARVFAAAGARVIVVAREREAAEATVREIMGRGGDASYLLADLAEPASADRLVGAALERHGRLDVLCCNAGIYPASPLREMSAEEIDQVLAVNVRSMMLSVRACLPHMERAGGGRVILTSSITGPITGYPGWSHYGASKAAQLGFMRTAAIELARARVTINAVLPGNIVTEGLEDLGDDYLRRMERSIPLGRLGSVEDVAHVALFLASDEAGYITGQTIVVDGGQTLPESLMALEES
ncbi:MAG TPA: 3-oxoacyl-ACP reductase FabG [Terriglobales bacterium]|nr:3-oxoacyl-ACP reductase FabG [Terriglobales bacterium]